MKDAVFTVPSFPCLARAIIRREAVHCINHHRGSHDEPDDMKIGREARQPKRTKRHQPGNDRDDDVRIK
jgi:hypothetical protein